MDRVWNNLPLLKIKTINTKEFILLFAPKFNKQSDLIITF